MDRERWAWILGAVAALLCTAGAGAAGGYWLGSTRERDARARPVREVAALGTQEPAVPVAPRATERADCAHAPDAGERKDLQRSLALTPQQRLAEARAAIESRDGATRLAALRGLLELDPGEGIAAVSAMVKDAERGGRTSEGYAAIAVRLLRRIDDGAVDRELRRYFEEGGSLVQQSAARTLEQRGDPSAMQTLVTEFLPQLLSKDVGTRANAVRVLGDMESPRALPVLLPLLQDPDSAVRARAAEAVATTADPITAQASIEPLLADPVPEVRQRTQDAIDGIRVDSRGPQLVSEQTPRTFTVEPGELMHCVRF